MSDEINPLNEGRQQIGLVSDRRNLQQLKAMGRGDKRQQALALKACAEQFQSMLNQYWVSAMCQSNDTINPDSPLHSKYSDIFEDMLTQEQTMQMTKASGMNKHSITYLLTKQFAKSLGDEGKELLKELDSMSVSGNSTSHNVSADIKSLNSFLSSKDSHVDTSSAISSLRKLYKGLPDPSSMSSFASEQEFVDKMMPYAIKAVEGLGFNPLVLVTQAALETGWGKHVPDNNNYYGIKAGSSWSGESSRQATKEYVDGRIVNEVSSFRKYSDVLESMKDYLKFINDNPRYQNAASKSYSPDEYFEEIQRAGYATDPDYADKLKKISRKIAFMAYK
ncbi:MAG: glucosaminidase domain-containing protein [Succinivibrio sp.]